MSRDLIAFDPTGLDGMSGDPLLIMQAINQYTTENEHPPGQPEPEATSAVANFLAEVSGRYLAAYLGANGRYCNMNRPGNEGDWENTIMLFTEAAQRTNVIMIDPQGNMPIMTTPTGDGLLDF